MRPFRQNKTSSAIYVIDIPEKIWRPKPQNRYKPIDYGNDVYDGMFDFKHYGKTVFRPKIQWAERPRTDLIIYNQIIDEEEMRKNLNVGEDVIEEHKITLEEVIIKYWDYFCKRGARRTILAYEFAIDTGVSSLVCCRRPTYNPHE